VKWLGGFLLAVILPLLLSEFTDWCPWLAKRLIDRAVRRLPQHVHERYEEEWNAELQSLEGRRLSTLIMGLWIFLRAPSSARILQGRPPLSQVLLARIDAWTQPPDTPTTLAVYLEGLDRLLEQLGRRVGKRRSELLAVLVSSCSFLMVATLVAAHIGRHAPGEQGNLPLRCRLSWPSQRWLAWPGSVSVALLPFSVPAQPVSGTSNLGMLKIIQSRPKPDCLDSLSQRLPMNVLGSPGMRRFRFLPADAGPARESWAAGLG
jgi:hypothetical protein